MPGLPGITVRAALDDACPPEWDKPPMPELPRKSAKIHCRVQVSSFLLEWVIADISFDLSS